MIRKTVGWVFNPPHIDTNQVRSSQAGFVCHAPLMLRGSYFFCFAKKSNQEKAKVALATIRLLPRIAAKKAERTKLASLKQFSVLIALLTAILGANQQGPRFAAGAAL